MMHDPNDSSNGAQSPGAEAESATRDGSRQVDEAAKERRATYSRRNFLEATVGAAALALMDSTLSCCASSWRKSWSVAVS